MNKNSIAAAVLALVSSLAAAQSNVTLYGIVDLGVLSQSHAAPGAATTSIASGGISPSIWGLRGTEDLGNGLKANFNLEGHIAADTGAAIGPLLRRQSNVGLSSAGMGTLTLGNQYSPAILAFAATDPRGLRENFSGLYSWAYNSGALTAGNNGNNDVGVFLQNAISYSNTMGAVGLAGAYSVSENKGAVYSLGATYAGPLALSAAYQSTNKPGTSDRLSSIYTVGAAYTAGDFTGKLNYLRGVNKNVALVETSKVGVIGVGLDWRTAANNTVMAAAYFGKDKNNGADKTNSLILSDEYALSKRTTLYGTLTFADAKEGATLLTTIVAGGTAANTNSTVLNLGIRHTF
ncbi:porin [Janthinobacterium sp.]|uniref:porin n=1 Tax=Janthinobacterium sp. TaxID=1871054 RepID=UPI00293D755B|nr:porin [Janthinobacterium sp.]